MRVIALSYTHHTRGRIGRKSARLVRAAALRLADELQSMLKRPLFALVTRCQEGSVPLPPLSLTHTRWFSVCVLFVCLSIRPFSLYEPCATILGTNCGAHVPFTALLSPPSPLSLTHTHIHTHTHTHTHKHTHTGSLSVYCLSALFMKSIFTMNHDAP